jgi:hypothetical protein
VKSVSCHGTTGNDEAKDFLYRVEEPRIAEAKISGGEFIAKAQRREANAPLWFVEI